MLEYRINCDKSKALMPEDKELNRSDPLAQLHSDLKIALERASADLERRADQCMPQSSEELTAAFEGVSAVVTKHFQLQQKRHVNAMEDIAEQTRTILYNLPLGLLIVDANLDIQAFNRKSLPDFGYSDQELLGMSLERLFPGIEESWRLSPNKNQIRIHGMSKVGMRFPCELTLSIDTTTDSPRIFVLVQDIEERFKLEQLRKNFMLMVSHDIRSPLSGIIGFLSNVEGGVYGNLSEPGMAGVSRTISSALFLSRLVDHLLNAERIECGDLKLELLNTCTSRVVATTINTLQDYAILRNVEVEIGLDSKSTLVADEERLVQVLSNLVSNAIQFSPEGKKVTISAEKLANDTVFHVQDQGAGIPAHMHNAIFERYRQVDYTSRTDGGFGLGLYICKGIVEAHRGKIWVESEEGSGSRFSFSIP